MPPGSDLLWNLAQDTLAAVVDYYAAQSVDLPARQLVADSSAEVLAWDCELLAVTIDRTFGIEGNVAAETLTPLLCLFHRGAGIAITLLRCVPAVKDNGAPPSVDEIEGSARQLLADAVLLNNAVVVAYRAGDLGSCHGIAVENWTVTGPQGGLGGGVLRLRAELA